MLTVHASGGTDMMRAAVEAAAGRLEVVGLTVVTSMNEGVFIVKMRDIED